MYLSWEHFENDQLLESNLNDVLNRPLIFTVVSLVAWPLNENEAGSDLVLIETSLLFLCKFALISMRTTSLTQE